MKLSKWPTLFLDDVETGVLLSDSAQQLRRKNSDVPDLYFTLLDAAGISQLWFWIAKAKERGSSIPFDLWTSEAV